MAGTSMTVMIWKFFFSYKFGNTTNIYILLHSDMDAWNDKDYYELAILWDLSNN